MKNYSIQASLQVLERTPKLLHVLLNGLPDEWVMQDEGEATWSALHVLSHLIFCEKMNFFTRINFIRSHLDQGTFQPFDMSTQFELTKGKRMNVLLTEFRHLREQNLATLGKHPVSEAELQRTAIHPELGTVTLCNVLSAWVVHDLAHTAQVMRVMAKQYRKEVGPFIEFLRILN
jgi:uncharacterized damage-inducible protein DinB